MPILDTIKPEEVVYRLTPYFRMDATGKDPITFWLLVENSLPDWKAFELLITGYRNAEPYRNEVH